MPTLLELQLLQKQLESQMGSRSQAAQPDPPPLEGWRGAIDQGISGLVGVIKGFTGLGDQGPAGPTATNLGQLLAAGMPLASIKALFPRVASEIEGNMAGGIKGLYSRVSRAAADLPDSLHPSKALGMFKNAASGEEIEFRGLGDYLRSQQGNKIGQSDILKHLEANPPPQVGAKALGEPTFSAYDLVSGKPRLANVSESKARSFIKNDLGGNGSLQRHSPVEPTQYSQGNLQLPGGTNYREHLFQLETPTIVNPEREALKKAIEEAGFDFKKTNVRMLNEAGYPSLAVRLKSYIDKADVENNVYRSSHWKEPNVLLHSRTNERSLLTPSGVKTQEALDKLKSPNNPYNTADHRGLLQDILDKEQSKGLFGEEFQSDLHQTGAKEGYKVDKLPKGYTVKLYDPSGGKENSWSQTGKPIYGVFDPDGKWVQAGLTPELAKKTALEVINKDRVPDAPFKTSWPDLALKKHLLDVANSPDEGPEALKWLGFTSGKTQNDRYNLATHIGKLQYVPPTGGNPRGYLDAYDTNGKLIFYEHAFEPHELPGVMGEDVAKRLLDSPKNKGGAHSISRLDIESGGKGMRQKYDVETPNRLSKLLKPFGGKVEAGKIPTGPPGSKRIVDMTAQEVDDARRGIRGQIPAEPAWLAHLSPEMKAAIRKAGFPLMALGGLAVSHDKAQPTDLQSVLASRLSRQ